MVATEETTKEEEEEEEEEICRICRCEQEHDRPLYHPCICTGSIRYVHEDCLLQWLSHGTGGNRSSCELCGHKFSFTPVYETGAPPSLTVAEFARLSIIRGIKFIPFGIRVIIVGITWGIFIPLATCVMFRILSLGKIDSNNTLQLAIENSSSGWSTFFLRMQVAMEDGFYSSWGIGVGASASIFLSFLTLISVVDFVREHDMLNELAAPDNEYAEHDEEVEEEEVDDDEEEEEIDNGEAAEPDDRVNDINNDDNIDEEEFFNEDNNGGDLNVALDELLGLRGPGWVLFHNVLWLLTFNGLYLCIALFFPTSVGGLSISLASRCMEALFGIVLVSLESESFLLRTQHKLVAIKRIEEAARVRFTQRNLSWDPRDVFQVYPPETCSTDILSSRDDFFKEMHLITLEVGAVLAGYIAIATGLWIVYCVTKWVQSYSSEATTRSNWNRMAKVLRLVSRTFKVAIIVFLKMGIFPVMLGILLEFAGRDLVYVDPITRFMFATDHPLFSVMTLWVAGITHMLVITVIVLELRDILHPDILHGIIRPKDTDDSLLRTVLEEPVVKHVRRMALSCAIYTFLVVAFIYVPIKIIQNSPFHDLVPIIPRFHYTILEVQLPVELVAIHVGVLNLLDQGKDYVRLSIEAWFKHACDFLGLTRYLLPIPAGDGVLLPRLFPRLGLCRLVALVVLAWLSCLSFTLAVIFAPFSIGKLTIFLLQLPITHQPLEYGLGCLVLWRVLVASYNANLHRAPRFFAQMKRQLMDTIEIGVWSESSFRFYANWFTFLFLALIAMPITLGMIIQLNFLFTSQSPDGTGTCPLQSSTSESPVFMEHLHHLIQLLTVPWTSLVYHWNMGMAAQLIVLQLIQLPDLMEQRDVFLAFHRRFVHAWQGLLSTRDCHRLLVGFVLPSAMIESAVLVIPCILLGVSDISLRWVFGVSISHIYGFLSLYRVFAITTVFGIALPFLFQEIQRTWKVIHDALRDERYLVGKRLHNMDRRSQNRSVVI